MGWAFHVFMRNLKSPSAIAQVGSAILRISEEKAYFWLLYLNGAVFWLHDDNQVGSGLFTYNPQPLSLVGSATSIIFVATNFLSTQTCVCCDKTHLLSWQKYACHDKTFVATNTCTFVVTKDMFCHDKHMFVMTKVSLVWQNLFGDKNDTCGSSHQR